VNSIDYTLTISCPDKVGLVHRITSFFQANHYNIIELDQYVDRLQDRFFMRLSFTTDGDTATGFLTGGIPPLMAENGLKQFMEKLNNGTEWELHRSDSRVRTALMVTRESHCLLDILSRSIDGELQIDIPVIISNHEDLGGIAERFGIPFEYVPVSKDNKAAAEARQLQILQDCGAELVVLAKYMQILSPRFIRLWRNRIINIHHSFLPAFPGSRPYHSAYYRGVKIIGATSHFVTEELDAGPIIEQDVIRIRHSDSIDDLKRKGKEVEKNVLSRAIWFYATRRILSYGNKTIIL
jgi:formyltetrahydrofolate deformylase